METGSLQKKSPKFFEEENQGKSMVITTNRGSNPAESTIPSVSTFKIPSFFLKTFQKRFDYCNTNNDGKEISSDIEKKKKCLIEFASLFGSKIDGEHQDSSSESEAEEEEYRDERDEIFYGSETKKKLLKNEKISSQLKLPVSILDVFSKKNAMDFNFSFVKSRICKGKNGNRNRNLDYDQNLRENESVTRLSRENLKGEGKNSTAISYHEDDEKGERLWQKRILMGERCKPVMHPSVSLR
ncbi:unnamed protein product [Citrullus colocynthis]|uniref:Uncharacterized protein n=1 Tax=Citrullus colocynthis TaxID=252529 RepID=A0ABP0Y164_9ROSI